MFFGGFMLLVVNVAVCIIIIIIIIIIITINQFGNRPTEQVASFTDAWLCVMSE